MNNSNTAWLNVWSSAKAQGQYAFPGGRLERALDKLNHFEQIGAIFNPGESVLEAGWGDGSIIISLIRKYKFKKFSPQKLSGLLVSWGDRFFHCVLPNWGFYSYAWGSKKENV